MITHLAQTLSRLSFDVIQLIAGYVVCGVAETNTAPQLLLSFAVSPYAEAMTFTPDGDQLWVVGDQRLEAFDSMDGKRVFSVENDKIRGPLDIAFGVARKAFVVSYVDHCILVFNSMGVFLRSLGCTGCPNERLRRPTGLAVHGDRLFVTDADNFRIAVFKTSGEFQSAIPCGEGWRPQAVVFNGAAEMLVAEYNPTDTKHRLLVRY